MYLSNKMYKIINTCSTGGYRLVCGLPFVIMDKGNTQQIKTSFLILRFH